MGCLNKTVEIRAESFLAARIRGPLTRGSKDAFMSNAAPMSHFEANSNEWPTLTPTSVFMSYVFHPGQCVATGVAWKSLKAIGNLQGRQAQVLIAPRQADGHCLLLNLLSYVVLPLARSMDATSMHVLRWLVQSPSFKGFGDE